MVLRKWILGILAISFAIVCIFLGAWQIRRLWARERANDDLAARRLAPEVELDSLPRDTAAAHFRRVHLRGSYDHEREIIYTLRGRNGSPGVNIQAPLDEGPHRMYAIQWFSFAAISIIGLVIFLRRT